ncbi:MAG TPA: DUF2846 domain-containing protein [Rhodanobacteraceae bacterium]|nr:DUF2846 domain-containing protein [Rhodanobacteraceae bacterium]
MHSFIARATMIATVGLMMAGCAGMQRSTSHPTPTVEPEHGLVYFYRESHFAGAAVQFDVRDNGNVIGALQSGTYFFENATPGEHTYSAKTEAKSDVTFNVEPGKTYYVQGSISMGFMAGHPHLKEVDAATAQAALPKLDYAVKADKSSK